MYQIDPRIARSPSWRQLVSVGIDVPHGATCFHTEKEGAEIVYSVNTFDAVHNVMTGAECVRRPLSSSGAQYLSAFGWLGTWGQWFWDCDKRGAQRKQS